MRKISKVICFILVIGIMLSAFVGCSTKNDATSSSKEETSSETSSIDEAVDTEEFEEETVEQDDFYEEFPSDEYEEESVEEDILVEELIVNNTKVINNNFRGISYVHQMASYYTDSLGRNYTDEQRAYELEIMKNMGVKNIRAFYGSAITYNAKTDTQDYNSERMQQFINGCKAMDSIGIEIGVTAIWTIKNLVSNVEDKSTAQFNLGAPGLVIVDDWDATVKNYRDFMKNTVLTFKAHGVNNIKYFFAYTECNNTFNRDGLKSDGTKANNTFEDREYDRLYPLYDDLITALDGGLKDAGLRKDYKIVGPCDNWRADDGSEDISWLTKYTVENLADKVDIIGSHRGYDRSLQYIDDMYYDKPPVNNSVAMDLATSAGKEFWLDEYDAEVTAGTDAENCRIHDKEPWKGVAVGAMMNSIMNMGGVSNIYIWTLWNEQWPDNIGGGEFHNGIQVCGYLNSLFETATPLPAWYSLSLLTKYIDSGKILECNADQYSVYFSAIERHDGEVTVVVTNYNLEDTKIKLEFQKSVGGKTFHRYLYNSTEIKPVSSSELLPSSGTVKNVTKGFYDILPAGSVAVYTTATD